jgi:hypothetical protein
MQDYDVTLKLLLQGSANATMRALTGTAVAKWLDVELPKVQNLRLDLLGETVDSGLVHIELQSGNDTAMPLRMAEYSLGVYRLLGRFPQQVVLYVGEPALGMQNKLLGPHTGHVSNLCSLTEGPFELANCLSDNRFGLKPIASSRLGARHGWVSNSPPLKRPEKPTAC